jgi:CO/xanthine dehydrogenase Mo-binding subunit
MAFYEEQAEALRKGYEPTPPPEEEMPSWGKTDIVGKPLPRVDAFERVSGKAQYTYDINLPNMVYAAILRCPHAHAMVKSVDTSAAEKMPGVVGVLTGESPGTDIPWYGGMGGAQSKLFDPHCRYEGEEVAAVAAQTPYQAWDALKAIKVDYEVLPFVIDPEKALEPDAPKLFANGNSTGRGMPSNRGDVEKGFAEADVVLEETFRTPVQMHAPIEAHGSVVKWDGDKITIWDSTQGVYAACMMDFARTMKLPYNNVRVICRYVGGAFGSKLELGKYTVIAALLARRSDRPVKLMLSREETMLCVGNRSEARMTLKAGVKKDGTLTALKFENFTTPGAYSNMAFVSMIIQELYKCPNVSTTERGAYTNAGRARAFRAPGFPEGTWALEQMMNMLAAKIGMDPIEFRLKNFTDISNGMMGRGRPYSSAGLKECLIQGAEKFGWKEARVQKKSGGPIKRGFGMAAGLWMMGSGGPPYTAEVRMFSDGGVTIKTGAMDLGTGTKTAAAMVVAEELGIPVENIRVINADTAITPYASSSGGSQTLPSLAPTVRQGAWILKRRIFDWAAEALGVPVDDIQIKVNQVASISSPEKKKTLEELFRSKNVLDVIAVGNRDPNPADKVVMPFGAHFAEVEVNTDTGEAKVVRLVAANESGRVINLKTFENQVYGGMTQGLGLALTEKRVMDRQTGIMCNTNLHDYKVPTAMDVPVDHEVVPVDLKDNECNNVGCKGLGEPGHVPAPAAIANAIADAIGVQPTHGPIDNKTILELLEKGGES